MKKFCLYLSLCTMWYFLPLHSVNYKNLSSTHDASFLLNSQHSLHHKHIILEYTISDKNTKAKLSQKDFHQENTIYTIKSYYALAGNISIPSGCM